MEELQRSEITMERQDTVEQRNLESVAHAVLVYNLTRSFLATGS